MLRGTATLTAGETLTVSINGATYTNVPVVNGQWILPITGPNAVTPSSGTLGSFPDGEYSVTATVIDAAGNSTTDGSSLELTIDSTAAQIAITGITSATDTGTTGDLITRNQRPAITGTSDQFNRIVTVTVTDGTNTQTLTTTTDGSGNWTVTPSANLPEGTYTVTASVTNANGGTGTATANNLVIDLTPPTVQIGSAAGDSVTAANSNGLFDIAERGFDSAPNVYTLTPGVATPPVISGTASGANGQTVTVALNGKSYTTTVQSNGTWTLPVPEADAKLLNHGTTYAITASVSDAAGNTGSDTDNGLRVNIAPPDVPTVVSQTTSSTTPTLTGLAQKLNNGTPIALSSGDSSASPVVPADTLTVVIQSSGGTALATYTLTVGGTSSPAGLTYNAATSTWSLAVPAGLGLTSGTYNVAVSTSVTSGGTTLTRSDVSSSELRIVGAPSITSIPEAPLGELLNIPEANSTDSGQAAGGTVVNVGIANTGASAGQVLTLNWGGQTVSHVLTAAEVSAGTVAVLVPTATLLAETPLRSTPETVAVTATVGGVTSTPTNVDVNFVLPTAPVISATRSWTNSGTAWAAATSTLNGVGEAFYDINSDTYPGSPPAGTLQDNVLYQSEVLAIPTRTPVVPDGTWLRVQIPSSAGTGIIPAQAGDTLTVSWGSNANAATATLSSADITAGFVDLRIPESVIRAESYGTVTTAARLTSASTGNTAQGPAVNVAWAWDLPLASPAGNSYGFAIDGASAGDFSGFRVRNAGDVNGDGYDDVLLSAPFYDTPGMATANNNTGAVYVVFGRPDLQRVNLSALSAGNSSEGFMIRGAGSNNWLGTSIDGNIDVNGDGLSDLVLTKHSYHWDINPSHTYFPTRAYVVYGRTATSTVELSALSPDQGYSLQIMHGNTAILFNSASPQTTEIGMLQEIGRAGDVNADGYDDFLVSRSPINGGDTIPTGAYVIYGTSAERSNVVLSKASVEPDIGFYVSRGVSTGTFGTMFSAGSDLNGDGHDDLLMGMGVGNRDIAVVYGGPSRTATFSVTQVSQAATSSGFLIRAASGSNYSFDYLNGSATDQWKLGSPLTMLGDANGDGFGDIALLTNATPFSALGAMVIFGQSGRFGAVDLSTLVQNSQTFVIDAASTINSSSAGLTGISDIGDFNGDGLSDLLVSSINQQGGASNATGRAWVVYGKTSNTPVMLSALHPSEGFRILSENATNNEQAGLQVSPGGDINGDGFTDLLIGSRRIDPEGRVDAGRTYVVFGGVSDLNPITFQASNGDIIGTTASETLNGTSGNNQIVAGDGDDTIIGNGGADVLYGGRGDDTFVLNADNLAQLAVNTGNASQAIMRVDGGAGIDTLRLSGGNLNLTTIRDAALKSIERIDLNGNSQTLTASAIEVINLTGRDNIYNTSTGYTATASNGAVGWGSLEPGNQLLVDGDATNRLTLGDNWTNLGTVQHTSGTVYKVLQSNTKAAQILVDDRVQLQVPPSAGIVGVPEAVGTPITIPEANSIDAGQSAGGTVVQVGFLGTSATVGSTLTLTWGGQTVSHVLTQAEIDARIANVLVPTATLVAETPLGTRETINVTASVGGVSTPAFPVTLDFITPQAPVIALNAPANFASPVSTLNGIPEALNNAQYSSVTTVAATPAFTPSADNTLYYSEVNNATNAGTWVRVQIPTVGATGVNATTAALAGDTLQIHWGTQTNAASVTLTAAHITAKFVDVLVPWSAIETQDWGNVAVSAQVINAAGNPGVTTLNVSYVFDLPLVSTTSNNYGFRINGSTTNELTHTPQAQAKLGDVNGDGYEDFAITGTIAGTVGRSYIVFGRPGQTAVELSGIGTAGNTQGFLITGLSNIVKQIQGNGDFNGDGLADIIVNDRHTDAVTYVIYGKTDNGTVNIANSVIAASDGFRVTADPFYDSHMSFLGDVNGDGLDDIGRDVTGGNFLSYAVVYGTTTPVNLTLPAASFGPFAGGFQIMASSTNFTDTFAMGATSGDINGDGYADILMRTESVASTGGNVAVFFGGPSWPGNLPGLNVAGNGRGYMILGPTDRNDTEDLKTGDMNGDGLDDVIIAVHNRTTALRQVFVGFGKTTDTSFTLAELSSGSSTNGFAIIGMAGGDGGVTTSYLGDFNGDGLGDLLVNEGNQVAWINGQHTGQAWVVFGKTSGAPVVLSALAGSDGFRINGESAIPIPPNARDFGWGLFASAPGDVNGDGFADLLVSARQMDPVNRTDGGISYIIYGGVSELNRMVFQASNGDIIGTTASETLTGTTGTNQLVAGEGDDVLIGAGGKDVLYGGAGNDRFVLDGAAILGLTQRGGRPGSTAGVLDGGTGIDTLDVAAGQMLSVAQLRNTVSQVERVLLGTGSTLQVESGLAANTWLDFNRFNTGNGWTVTGTVTGFDDSVNYRQLLVDGVAASVLRLGSGFVKESGSLSYSGSLTTAGSYDVYTNASTRTQLIVKSEVSVTSELRSTMTLLTPEAELSRSFGTLTLAEANDAGAGYFASAVAGTPVTVSLAGTGAVAGNTLRIIWDNQTPIDVVLSSTDIQAGTVRVTVPTATLLAATASGTREMVEVSAQLLNGSTALAPAEVNAVQVDFTTPPAAPASGPVINSANSTGSALAGIAEANTETALYVSEAVDGTTVNVYFRSAAAVGDWVRVNWGNESFTTRVETAMGVGSLMAIRVPYSVIEAQGFGTFNVSVQHFTANGLAGTAVTAANTLTNVRYMLDVSTTTAMGINGAAAADLTGYAISAAGDVNGDGYEDFVVGAPQADPGGRSNAGQAFVVFGSSSGLAGLELTSLTQTGNGRGFALNGALANHYMGGAVSGGGDINGDGLADIIIGGPSGYRSNYFLGIELPGSSSGGVADTPTYVVFGKSDTAAIDLSSLSQGTSSAGFQINSPTGFNAGYQVSNVGDFNGDGLADVLVTAPMWNGQSGVAYVVYGKTSGTAVNLASFSGAGSTQGFLVAGDTYSGSPGVPVIAGAGSGDFNGDGLSDIVIGTRNASNAAGVANSGGAFVVYGRQGGQSNMSLASLTTGTNGYFIDGEGETGLRVAGVADVNGDGLDDVLMHSHRDGSLVGTQGAPGAAWVVFGKSTAGNLSLANVEAGNGGFGIDLGLYTGSFGGFSAASAGDVNGDGLGDVFVSAVGWGGVDGSTNTPPTGTADNTGAAYVIFGKTSTSNVRVSAMAMSEGFRINGPGGQGDRLGHSLDGTADLNGDGFTDLILGTPTADPAARTDAGQVFVVFGGASQYTGMVIQASNGDAIGSSGNDNLDGTSGNNQLVGGDGDDVLTGNGGRDVMYGGRGNDTFVLNADNVAQLSNSGSSQAIARIDGGTGIDTLRLDGAGITLDFTLLTGAPVQSVERIDLTGSGNNTVRLALVDVLDLGANNAFDVNPSATDTRKQLLLTGDAGDRVVLTDVANWTQVTGANSTFSDAGHTYNVWNHNSSGAQLLIDQALGAPTAS